jgi:small-conductance mechanosensitive channel
MRKTYRFPQICRWALLPLLLILWCQTSSADPVPTAHGPASAIHAVAHTTPLAAVLASTHASAAATATPVSAASAAAPTHALVSNGLIAQLVHQSSRWGRAAIVQLRNAAELWHGFSSFGSDVQEITRTEERRAELFKLAWMTAGILLVALAGEWLIAWALQHLRELLAQRAQRAEAAVRQNNARKVARIPAENAADAARDAAARAEAGIDAVPVDLSEEDDADIDASDTSHPSHASDKQPTASTTQTAQAAQMAQAAQATQAAQQAASASSTARTSAKQVRGAVSAATHWRLLQQLPYVLAHFVLTLVPPIAFFLIATSLASLWVDSTSATQDVLDTLINAYLVVRTVMIIVRLFIAPRAPALRLLNVSDTVAYRLQIWMRWIVGVAVLGNALADVATSIGFSDDLHDALSRFAVLVGHVLLVAMVLRYRRAVARRIRSATAHRPSLALLGAWLSDIWAIAAISLIVALWFVWALDVKNGLARVFDLFGQSIAVLAAARVVAIVVLGGLARVFHTDEPESLPPASRRALRYYPVLRRMVSTLISLVAIVMILEVLGVDAWKWILAGSIGKNLLSACITVGVSCVVALLIWESTNAIIERRLERWSDAEDRLRAARLRTLLPMLRSILFIVIAMIIGMTALNQLGVNTAPLLASASIIGVALGFGSQKLVQDFITGIFLLMENAMQVGDWVTVAGVSGTVEYLSIRTVRLRGGDGSLYTVPFSSVTTVNNTNRGVGNAAVKVSVAYDEDLDRVVTVLKEIGAEMRQDPAFADAILNDFEYWGVDLVDGAMISLSGQIRARDSGRWGVQREFNRRMLKRFRELGIRVADNQRRFIEETPAQGSAQAPAHETAAAGEIAAAHNPTPNPSAPAHLSSVHKLATDSSQEPSAQSAKSGDNKPPK